MDVLRKIYVHIRGETATSLASVQLVLLQSSLTDLIEYALINFNRPHPNFLFLVFQFLSNLYKVYLFRSTQYIFYMHGEESICYKHTWGLMSPLTGVENLAVGNDICPRFPIEMI